MVSLVRNNRGNAVIEFALVLPLILLLIYGITEFGRAWMTINVMHSAAREGVRLAVVSAPDVTAVEARVNQVCGAAGITPTSIVVSGPDPNDPDRKVTVTVQATFQVIPGNPDHWTMTGSIPLSASTTMRHEAF